MAKFGQMKAMHVDQSKVRALTLHGVVTKEGADPVVLYGVFAGDSNVAYANEALRRAALRNREPSPKNLTIDMLERIQADEVEIFSEFVLNRWDNVFDEKGKECPFGKEDCIELLSALPSDVVSGVTIFYKNIVNFREENYLSKEAAKDLGKS